MSWKFCDRWSIKIYNFIAMKQIIIYPTFNNFIGL